MLPLIGEHLDAEHAAALGEYQAAVDASGEYVQRIEDAKTRWDGKSSTRHGRVLFAYIRSLLSEMCSGIVRCAYCEDSVADEIEHLAPKAFFPERCFIYQNMAFACGPCNGPKGSNYGVLVNGTLHEFRRRRGEAPVAPPAGVGALIDPRAEDPTFFFDMDIGGVTPDHQRIPGTFHFLPRSTLPVGDRLRAEFTIRTLRLNRDLLTQSRRNAFGGYRARLVEYVRSKEDGADEAELLEKKADLLRAPHLTVFFEMRRQRQIHPDINDLLNRAPEALTWRLPR